MINVVACLEWESGQMSLESMCGRRERKKTRIVI